MQCRYGVTQPTIRYYFGSFDDQVLKGKVKTPQSIMEELIDKLIYI